MLLPLLSYSVVKTTLEGRIKRLETMMDQLIDIVAKITNPYTRYRNTGQNRKLGLSLKEFIYDVLVLHTLDDFPKKIDWSTVKHVFEELLQHAILRTKKER